VQVALAVEQREGEAAAVGQDGRSVARVVVGSGWRPADVARGGRAGRVGAVMRRLGGRGGCGGSGGRGRGRPGRAGLGRGRRPGAGEPSGKRGAAERDGGHRAASEPSQDQPSDPRLAPGLLHQLALAALSRELALAVPPAGHGPRLPLHVVLAALRRG
jgi:hypothetical protein